MSSLKSPCMTHNYHPLMIHGNGLDLSPKKKSNPSEFNFTHSVLPVTRLLTTKGGQEPKKKLAPEPADLHLGGGWISWACGEDIMLRHVGLGKLVRRQCYTHGDDRGFSFFTK